MRNGPCTAGNTRAEFRYDNGLEDCDQEFGTVSVEESDGLYSCVDSYDGESSRSRWIRDENRVEIWAEKMALKLAGRKGSVEKV